MHRVGQSVCATRGSLIRVNRVKRLEIKCNRNEVGKGVYVVQKRS